MNPTFFTYQLLKRYQVSFHVQFSKRYLSSMFFQSSFNFCCFFASSAYRFYTSRRRNGKHYTRFTRIANLLCSDWSKENCAYIWRSLGQWRYSWSFVNSGTKSNSCYLFLNRKLGRCLSWWCQGNCCCRTRYRKSFTDTSRDEHTFKRTDPRWVNAGTQKCKGADWSKYVLFQTTLRRLQQSFNTNSNRMWIS